RLSRLGSAAPPPPPAEHTADPVAPGEGELDILGREVGRRMGLSSNELTQLATASRFRDLGMSVVPDEIITKIGPLSDEEWAIVRQHPPRSARRGGPSCATIRAAPPRCSAPARCSTTCARSCRAATSTSTAAATPTG